MRNIVYAVVDSSQVWKITDGGTSYLLEDELFLSVPNDGENFLLYIMKHAMSAPIAMINQRKHASI